MRKKKILHVLDSLCVGGMEKIVIEICNLLDKSENEVFLLVLSSDDQSQIKRLNSDVKLVVLPLNHKDVMKTTYMFSIIPRLAKCIKRISPDIVHTHSYPYRLTAIQIALRLASYKIKHYHTIHTSGIHYENKSFRQKLKLKIEKMGYFLFHSNIVAVSDEVYKKSDCFFHGSYRALRCIYNGVDLKIFSKEQYHVEDGGTFNLVYVSRLHEGKNHLTLFKAIQLLYVKYSDIRMFIIGDGDLHDRLENFIIENHLEKVIFLLKNRDDIPELLAMCKLGVFPSEFEGFSLALLEMMAMELPIICSDISAFNDLFRAETDVLFFPVNDYVQLARNIEKIYLDVDLQGKYALRSRIIAGRYGIEKMVSKYADFYQF